jgi:hypothetical protein
MKSRLAHFLIGLLLGGWSKKHDDPTVPNPAGAVGSSMLPTNVTRPWPLPPLA